MNVSDIIKNVNTYIGDSSNDRISAEDRYQAITEATAWLLEELGNEHMVDRAEIEYLPTVTWYKMDTLTPYLLTAGQLRFKHESGNREDFTRVEARDLATMPANRLSYAIERYNGDSYLGIVGPQDSDSSLNEGCSTDLIPLNESDGYTYTGINAVNIVEEHNAIRFDMDITGQSATGVSTTSNSIDLTNYEGTGTLIYEIEIPDITDVTSVTIKFGSNLSTDYWLGVVTQDVNGNPLASGVNTVKFKWADLTEVGSPTIDDITLWQFQFNHETDKVLIDDIKISDLRIVKPIYLNFKYIFYRVGKSSAGTDLIEFTTTTDVPFFIERYPQYRFAVAHKAAAVLFRSLVLDDKARTEERDATNSLGRFKKNFSGERDMGSSAFKVAGVSLRNKRLIRRR